MSKLYKKTKDWVEKIYFNANHLVRTSYWIKKLTPYPSEALLLAALTHDMERAFDKGRKPPSKEMGDWDDPMYNQWHARRSAKFVSEFFKKEGADSALIKKVSNLIKYHEEGGSRETDLLKDADSISFLEINISFFISRIPKELNKKEVREKFNYMLKRIGSQKARELAKPFYEKAIAKLSKIRG